MKLFIIILLTTLLSTWTDTVQAKIFICIDEQGRKHYSDKMCPRKIAKQTEYYRVKGKTIPPKNVTDYTPVLKLARESLALLQLIEPDQLVYSALYDTINKAHNRHVHFLSFPESKRFARYDPLGTSLQQQLIATLSTACRIRGHLTICAAIEGNPWFTALEQEYFDLYKENFRLTKRFCEKAESAHIGGVISRQMQNFFCQTVN